jgi:molecular chaperone DnaK
MASDNVTLGKFTLDGIPPAPRGIPQIEVTFDIDANGIVNVTAKDKGTGKVQHITIQSSRLSDADIEKMKRDAESHEGEDKKKKELIEARNEADSFVYNAEKTLRDLGDKVTSDERTSINASINALRDAMTADDLSRINSAKGDLETAMHPMAQRLYEAKAAEQQGAPSESAPTEGPGAAEESATTVDADFKETDN